MYRLAMEITRRTLASIISDLAFSRSRSARWMASTTSFSSVPVCRLSASNFRVRRWAARNPLVASGLVLLVAALTTGLVLSLRALDDAHAEDRALSATQSELDVEIARLGQQQGETTRELRANNEVQMRFVRGEGPTYIAILYFYTNTNSGSVRLIEDGREALSDAGVAELELIRASLREQLGPSIIP